MINKLMLKKSLRGTLLPDGQKIARLRLGKGWSQEDLTELSKSTKRTIQRIEKGKPAYAKTLQCVANTLGVSVAEITIQLLPVNPALSKIVRYFVGRKKERDELWASCAEAFSGQGNILCVAGEPGIGKTTLVDSFLMDLGSDARPCYIARGRCSDRLVGAEAYLPFFEILKDLLCTGEGRHLTSLLKELAPTWYLQIATVSNESKIGFEVNLRSESQVRLMHEINAFIQTIAQERLVVLFFDDMHWADNSTIELLSYLASKLEGLRLLIIVSYRPHELAAEKQSFVKTKLDLQARGLLREIDLPFLAREDVANYVAHRFPGHHVQTDIVALIHRKTEGNPLFMVDLLDYLHNQRVIVEVQEQLRLAQALPELAHELPQSVRAMIQRKIEQLTAADHSLLTTASVQGYEFDATVLAEATGQDLAEVEEQLAALERTYGLVSLVNEQRLPDKTLTLHYRFIHVLYQNALYASLQMTRKMTLNNTIAEVLLGHYGEQRLTVASKIAFLFEEGREYSRAAEYYLLAAQNKVQVFANWEVSVLARRGLEMLQALPQNEERDKLELELNILLGVPLMAVKGYGNPEVEQLFQRAYELCKKYKEDASIFDALWGLWGSDLAKGDITSALIKTEEIRSLAKKTQNEDHLLQADLVTGLTLSRMGELSSASIHLGKAENLYDNERHSSHKFTYAHDPGVYCLAISSWNLWFLGYPGQALRRSKESLELAKKIGHPVSFVFAKFFESVLYQMRREPLQAVNSAETTIDIANDNQLLTWGLWSQLIHGYEISVLGQPEVGLAQMRDSLANLDATGSKLARPHFLGLVAEILTNMGKVEEGLQIVNEAIEFLESTGDRYYEAELYRLKGEILLQIPATIDKDLGRAIEAEAYFQLAIETSYKQQAKLLELRAVVSLCRLYLHQGKTIEAHPRLANIYGWFTEGFDAPDLKDAKSLLDELATVGYFGMDIG